MRYINILGSTGSIGTQTLDVVRNSNGGIKVAALAAGRNTKVLAQQIEEFKPMLVCTADESYYDVLKTEFETKDTQVVFGEEGLIKAAAFEPADMTVTAIVGMMGILPTIKAIEAGKDIALANKETLVTAGHIIMPLAKKKGIKIFPVDSEHSAIYQCLQGEDHEAVNKLIITASGGPFRGFTKEQLTNVTLEEALNHPNWSMGNKITIDSATLCNKGLEVIEAHWLFDMPYERIQAVIHPQSIIHSMVEFCDGGIKAQLGTPDMKLPIQYALLRSQRRPLNEDFLDIISLSRLDFYEPDVNVFKGLKYAYDAGRTGGNMPVIFNAANEFAVAGFLKKEITFTQIYELIERAMDGVGFKDSPDLETVLETEHEVYGFLTDYLRGSA